MYLSDYQAAVSQPDHEETWNKRTVKVCKQSCATYIHNTYVYVHVYMHMYVRMSGLHVRTSCHICTYLLYNAHVRTLLCISTHCVHVYVHVYVCMWSCV